MKYGLENQFDVTQKRPMVEIIEVDSHLVRPDDIVIVPFWVDLLSKHFFFVTILDAGRTCYARPKLENPTVIALQLVGIARYIGTRPDKTHLSNQYIDEFCEAIHLAVTQPMADTRDARVASNGDTVALSLLVHGAELEDTEGLSVFSNTPLHKEDRPF